ncbi:hypothetical protein BH20BAC1_BH20BAC1_27740 [soil metagenome]
MPVTCKISNFFFYTLFLFLILAPALSFAQATISGTVFDSTKLYVVPNVTVVSTSGQVTKTDSLGAYHIIANNNDSLSFVYNGKSTVQFPVKTITSPDAFNISLRIRIKDKYKLLKGVTVYANSYRQDSLENRIEYSNVFNRDRPGIQSSYDPGGAAGLDLDALIGIFQFRKNKQSLAFQRRLLEEEQEKFVNYRFNSFLIKRITGLSGDTLVKYKSIYRPSYDFVISSTLTQFYQYILNTSYAFKREQGLDL